MPVKVNLLSGGCQSIFLHCKTSGIKIFLRTQNLELTGLGESAEKDVRAGGDGEEKSLILH